MEAAKSGAFVVKRRGNWPPSECGQKNINCRRAAEWKVLADAFGTPSCRKRARISPAARAVKVSARVLDGSATPDATAYAMRCVITRVLPVPAPAITQTGPRIAVTASRCSASRPSNICSGFSAMQLSPTLRTIQTWSL